MPFTQSERLVQFVAIGILILFVLIFIGFIIVYKPRHGKG